MRAWQTAAILQDMAKRVNIGDASTNGPPLPEVCFTHLEYLEKVDRFSNAPNLMDQTNWPILCRMRREKIEVEFKVRSCGALLAEAEGIIYLIASQLIRLCHYGFSNIASFCKCILKGNKSKTTKASTI